MKRHKKRKWKKKRGRMRKRKQQEVIKREEGKKDGSLNEVSKFPLSSAAPAETTPPQCQGNKGENLLVLAVMARFCFPFSRATEVHCFS